MQGVMDRQFLVVRSLKETNGPFFLAELIPTFRKDFNSTLRKITDGLYLFWSSDHIHFQHFPPKWNIDLKNFLSLTGRNQLWTFVSSTIFVWKSKEVARGKSYQPITFFDSSSVSKVIYIYFLFLHSFGACRVAQSIAGLRQAIETESIDL